jgi:hypothetical protein
VAKLVCNIGITGNNCSPRTEGENTMIVKRRTWLYRLAGQRFVQSISFEHPVTASWVRDALRQSVGIPVELWKCSSTDMLLR